MTTEQIKPTGTVTFQLTGPDGIVKQTEVCNLVVNTGLSFIAKRLKDATVNAASHIAVGAGTTAAAGTQTTLVSELSRVVLASTTIVTTTVTDDSIQYVATFGSGAALSNLTEAGLFNAASAGLMIARTVFPVINKGALDSFSVTWKLNIA